MRYKARPIVIEAVQFTGTFENLEVIRHWSNNEVRSYMGDGNGKIAKLTIFTLEGAMTAIPTDFIVRGTRGEYYPVKSAIFAEKYEAVE